MISFVLANWKWLLGATAAALFGIYAGVLKIEVSSLKAAAAKTALAIEKQKTEAATLLADETTKVLARERENAALNATLEKERADAQAQHVADNANLRDAMATWVRQYPAGGACRSSPNGADRSPAKPSDVAGIGVEQLPAGSGAFISRAAAAADELAAYARECHGFVSSLK